MKLFYAGLIAALCMAFHTEAKPKKPSKQPHKADVSGKKADQKRGQKPKQTEMDRTIESVWTPLDGFFIQGRKLIYSLQTTIEMANTGDKMPGFVCPKGKPFDNCVQKVEGKITCTIDKVEEQGVAGSKGYSRKSTITCDPKTLPAEQGPIESPHLESHVAGCWVLNDAGITHYRICDNEDSAVEIFKNPAKIGKQIVSKDEYCESTSEIILRKNGLLCSIESSDCGDGSRSEDCYTGIEGLISSDVEFSGGVYVHSHLELKNPILRVKNDSQKGSQPDPKPVEK